MKPVAPTRALLADTSGSVADLGTLVPIAAALVLKNGLDPATVFVGVGALYVAAGLYFKVPVPVQPIKAAAAIAIARGLAPADIAAAGIVLGMILVVVAATGAANLLNRLFAKPIVRGLQLGVGLILLRTAFELPDGGAGVVYVAASAVALVLVVASRRSERWPVALILVVAGAFYTLVQTGAALSPSVSVWRPELFTNAFDPSVMWMSFVLLVIPQIPLTLANAVVAVNDLEHKYFGDRSGRVSPASISMSSGLANVLVGCLGGMPMCHGSGGLTAHYRAGARTNRMNLVIGGVLLVLGVAFGGAALQILNLVPIAVLMGLLAFTGVMHSSLIADLRGHSLAVAVAMGILGFLTANLAIALAAGLIMFWAPRRLRSAAQVR